MLALLSSHAARTCPVASVPFQKSGALFFFAQVNDFIDDDELMMMMVLMTSRMMLLRVMIMIMIIHTHLVITYPQTVMTIFTLVNARASYFDFFLQRCHENNIYNSKINSNFFDPFDWLMEPFDCTVSSFFNAMRYRFDFLQAYILHLKFGIRDSEFGICSVPWELFGICK